MWLCTLNNTPETIPLVFPSWSPMIFVPFSSGSSGTWPDFNRPAAVAPGRISIVRQACTPKKITPLSPEPKALQQSAVLSMFIC